MITILSIYPEKHQNKVVTKSLERIVEDMQHMAHLKKNNEKTHPLIDKVIKQ